jgi:signal transduction histidine kinase
LRPLPLRTRLFLALATVAVLPATLFGIFAVAQATAALNARQESGLADVAQLAARSVGGTLDAATAARIGALTERHAALFFADGRSGGSSDNTVVVDPPPQPGAPEPAIIRTRGRVTAYQPVLRDGVPLGTLALTEEIAPVPEIAPALLGTLGLTILLAGGLLSFALARSLIRPLTDMTARLDRLQAGDLTARLPVEGEDELGRLAESHNRLADALAQRNRSLASVLEAVAHLSPRAGREPLVAEAERAAREAFGFLDARIELGQAEPDPLEERVPGEAYSVHVPLELAAGERVGILTAVHPPTRDWSQADADLLALFGRQLAAGIRNSELFAEVESLSELKSEFLRGVSHNLQTPLTSISAFASQLAQRSDDPRLRIIVDQSERLSRLVGQLLTVSKLEAGTLRPDIDVLAVAPLVRRVWESLGRGEQPFAVHDEAPGWLAVADPDWVEQVVWALLDNAVKYGGREAIAAVVRVEERDGLPRLVTTVRDSGPGVPEDARERVFERFERLGLGGGDGTGLGLSVARGLVEGMGGGLWLEPPDGLPGAAFSFSLPAERIEDR